MAVNAMGHRTDAATVYEKGVPPIVTREGFFRALELFLELVPGARIVSKMESMGDDGKAKPLTLSPKHLASVLGTDIPAVETTRILTDLGFDVAPKGKQLSVTPPLWRLGDIRTEIDLIEEVGRIHGYDAIPSLMPSVSASVPPRDPRVHALRDALKESSFIEVLPLSLLGSALISKANLNPADSPAIENPLGEELGRLHPSTIPALLEHASKNLPLTEKSLSIFECAHSFSRAQGEWMECGLLLADRKKSDFKETPFLRLKSHLLTALRPAGWTVTVRAAHEAPPFGHPGRSRPALRRRSGQGGRRLRQTPQNDLQQLPHPGGCLRTNRQPAQRVEGGPEPDGPQRGRTEPVRSKCNGQYYKDGLHHHARSSNRKMYFENGNTTLSNESMKGMKKLFTRSGASGR